MCLFRFLPGLWLVQVCMECGEAKREHRILDASLSWITALSPDTHPNDPNLSPNPSLHAHCPFGIHLTNSSRARGVAAVAHHSWLWSNSVHHQSRFGTMKTVPHEFWKHSPWIGLVRQIKHAELGP